MKWVLLSILGYGFLCAEAVVVPHEEIQEFSKYGIVLKGLSTKSMGAKEFEVWHSSIGVGSKTPKHVHDSEEVFVLLEGEILAIVGGEEVNVTAPGTLICPANVPHQLFNIGTVPTNHFLVVGIDSKIYNEEGSEMQLPWRK